MRSFVELLKCVRNGLVEVVELIEKEKKKVEKSRD
jgi:hypothetical protein